MTKQERRAEKGKAPATTSQTRKSKAHVGNVTENSDDPAMDPYEKAKKNKKKLPKAGVRVKPPKKRPQSDEIPISQNAPNAEELVNASQNFKQGGAFQENSALGLQATQRMKQPIVRPQIPATTSLKASTPPGVSAEMLAATSSGTAARLFKYMPTPGFKPPRQK
ncbi:hypothetical protein PIB30_019074 [Stylosanthes scabra]|uniref:Uncharacterized protein n=1 Tax=Stylosanthes scabra TaxID=79078 RepID=A0ABU6T8Z3_9FABA|nr:hypothetical protein [Stylosanthes scabra]